MRRSDFEQTLANSPNAAVEAARRRPGCALAVAVIDTAVAGAHEEPGLRKPGDRAAQVSAVHGQNQELIRFRFLFPLEADVDPGIGGDPVPGLSNRVVEGYQPRLAEWKFFERAQRDPLRRKLRRPQKKTDKGDPGDRRGDNAQSVAEPLQETPAALLRGCRLVHFVMFRFHGSIPNVREETRLLRLVRSCL